MKTPEKIKNGLECCTTLDCVEEKCPYFPVEYKCFEGAMADALALIKQLEAENAQLKRERDEAVHDLNKLACKSKCLVCKAYDGFEHHVAEICTDCYNGSKFEWRGPCEENGGLSELPKEEEKMSNFSGLWKEAEKIYYLMTDCKCPIFFLDDKHAYDAAKWFASKGVKIQNNQESPKEEI